MAALDGLRGVAILLVLGCHLRYATSSTVSLNGGLLPGAFLGVDLFFVLSGFLITGLLVREFGRRRRVRFGAFCRRRFLRLYPALVVVLIAHAVYASRTAVPWSAERPMVQSIFLYYSNWRQTLVIPAGLGQMWSLAVEEQFYIVWPLVLVALLLLTHGRRRWSVPLVAAAIVAVAVYRAWRWQAGMFWLFMYSRTDMRADSLLVGALLAIAIGGLDPGPMFFTRHRWVVPSAWAGAAAFVVCVLFVQVDESFLYLGGFTLVATACSVILLGVLPGSPWIGARLLAVQPLRVLGTVSYGLYLWHLVVFVAVERYATSLPTVVKAGLALGITALCTVVSWLFVERPFLQWKDRLEARHSVPNVAAAATAPTR